MGVHTLNRGGRGHKAENPSYCTDDTQRDIDDFKGKVDGCARLRAAIMLHYEKLARQWNVDTFMAMRIVDGMQRASSESYNYSRNAA